MFILSPSWPLLFSQGKVQPLVRPCLRPWVPVLPAADDRDLRCCPHRPLDGAPRTASPNCCALRTCGQAPEVQQHGRRTVADISASTARWGAPGGLLLASSFSNQLVQLGSLLSAFQGDQVITPRPLSGDGQGALRGLPVEALARGFWMYRSLFPNSLNLIFQGSSGTFGS